MVESDADTDDEARTELEGLDVYADALLLIDAPERHDVTDLPALETNALVDIYTLLSDVQRDANEFRQAVADVLLGRLHPPDSMVRPTHESSQPLSLKDDEDVLARLAEAGINRERVLSVDRSKVDDALDVTPLSESNVYEIEDREYVRKADVDDDVKESRLQGLKDRLAASEGDDTEDLRQEIEALEQRIDDLTSFRTGADIHD